MEPNDKVIEQLNRIADMLFPFAAGISPECESGSGHAYDPATDARETDSGALEWYGMLRMAAAMLEGQSSALTQKQLLYLQKTFASRIGTFQEFKLSGDQEWANKKLDLERGVLAELLANYTPEDGHASYQSA